MFSVLYISDDTNKLGFFRDKIINALPNPITEVSPDMKLSDIFTLEDGGGGFFLSISEGGRVGFKHTSVIDIDEASFRFINESADAGERED